MHRWMHGRAAVSILLGLAAMGCSGADSDGVSGEPREPFIALASDFDGWPEWPSITIEGAPVPGGHGGGLTNVYLGGELPADGDGFSVGTILVKSTEVGAPPDWEVHGMVKRGGGYNPDGALGWEWFDLAVTEALEPILTWRGEGSPADPGGYAAPAGEQGCNSCHVLAITRDFVFTRMLLRGAE